MTRNEVTAVDEGRIGVEKAQFLPGLLETSGQWVYLTEKLTFREMEI